MESRTATLVTEKLHQLDYSLALGREIVNESSRTGLSDEFTLQREFECARQQGALAQWIAAFGGGFADIVTILDTGRPGPVTVFRVDVDTLSLGEEQGVSHRPYRDDFASCNIGIVHTYGYDGHTVAGFGLVYTLKQFESGPHGVIKLILQPTEEDACGTRAMVDVDVVGDVDYFTVVHIGTGVSTGTVVCSSDNFVATTKFDVYFTGIAVHAGVKPRDDHNALSAAIQATLALYIIAPHSGGAPRINAGVTQAGSGRNVVLVSVLLKVETCGTSDATN